MSNFERNILNEDPLVFTISNFVSADDCEHFIKISKPNLKRAFVSDTKKGTYSNGRTGSNYWVQHGTDDVTMNVGTSIAEAIKYPLENAEAYQVVHYDKTERYDNHYDSYQKNASEKCLRCLKYGGQRMMTALVYLNDVEEGGGTRFEKLNINVKAEKGKLLVFQNYKNGTNDVHPLSLHAGMPVIKGEKYAFNLWFRELSMKELYDFPFLKTNAVEPASVEPKVIELNSSTNMSITHFSTSPCVIQIKGILCTNVCNDLKSRCVGGQTQPRGRISHWINNSDTNASTLLDLLHNYIPVDRSFFENMNVIEYPSGSNHGFHFDAFDLTTERGKSFSKQRGQRLYTVVGLLGKNENVQSGLINFKNYDFDIIHEQGSILIMKNVVDNVAPRFQRNEKIEYAINTLQSDKKYYFYLHLREKNSAGEEVTPEMIATIDERLAGLESTSLKQPTVSKEPVKTLDEINKQLAELQNGATKENKEEVVTRSDGKKEVGPESRVDYMKCLEDFYDNFNKTKAIVPHGAFKFKRNHVKNEIDITGLLSSIRSNIEVGSYHSILTKENLDVSYVQNEYTPVAVNNVFTSDALKQAQRYFDDGIQNKRFVFGDRQSQRYKAYDDYLSRLLQYEMLPLVEQITSEELIPTYTYLSAYVKDADLPAHTDRADCEFTVSFLINKPENTSWPIYVDKTKQPIKSKGRYNFTPDKSTCVPVDCDAGGMMIFNGIDHIHFREPLPYEFYYVVLLHYRRKYV